MRAGTAADGLGELWRTFCGAGPFRSPGQPRTRSESSSARADAYENPLERNTGFQVKDGETMRCANAERFRFASADFHYRHAAKRVYFSSRVTGAGPGLASAACLGSDVSSRRGQ